MDVELSVTHPHFVSIRECPPCLSFRLTSTLAIIVTAKSNSAKLVEQPSRWPIRFWLSTLPFWRKFATWSHVLEKTAFGQWFRNSSWEQIRRSHTFSFGSFTYRISKRILLMSKEPVDRTLLMTSKPLPRLQYIEEYRYGESSHANACARIAWKRSLNFRSRLFWMKNILAAIRWS